ncbi:MAG: hypothetical protein Q7U23_13755, partial [Methylococcales bacterium]|nr:hypothetical protein [Methylococcales bacterium]
GKIRNDYSTPVCNSSIWLFWLCYYEDFEQVLREQAVQITDSTIAHTQNLSDTLSVQNTMADTLQEFDRVFTNQINKVKAWQKKAAMLQQN